MLIGDLIFTGIIRISLMKIIIHLFFDKVMAIKEEEGLDGIELQVNARNAAAREMYRKCGFTEKSINMELL